MNILLTCAGRRNYLVRYFQEAVSGFGKVYAVDSTHSAPALHEADHAFVVPPVSDPNYIDVLEHLCRTFQIKLIFSLNDHELPILSQEKKRFLRHGTVLVISDPWIIDLCFDKWETAQYLQSLGLMCPRTYLKLDDAIKAIENGDLLMPVVVKPRWGTASQLIEYPQTISELELVYQLNQLRLQRSGLLGSNTTHNSGEQDGMLIQEMLVGSEYGLDIVNDLEGRYVTTFVKKKLAMRAGETDKACTVFFLQLQEIGRKIGEHLRHVGNLDCDVFVSGENISILEMNPRFGGGYPFSHSAGGNLPAAFISWAEGHTPRSELLQLKFNITSAKCDRLVDVSELTDSKRKIEEIRFDNLQHKEIEGIS